MKLPPTHQTGFNSVTKPQRNDWFDDLPSYPGLCSSLLMGSDVAPSGWNGMWPVLWQALVIECMAEPLGTYWLHVFVNISSVDRCG